MPSPLSRFQRSDEEIAAAQSYNVLMEASTLYTKLRSDLEILKAKTDGEFATSIQNFLDEMDGVSHDSIEATLHVASNRLQDFANEREAREADGERSSLMLRQVGR